MPKTPSKASKDAKADLLAGRKEILARIEQIETEAEEVSAAWVALLKMPGHKKIPADDPVGAMAVVALRALQAEWSFYLRCLGFHANRLREFKVKEEIADAVFLSLVREDVSRLKSRLLGLVGRSGAMVAGRGVAASEEAARLLEEAVHKVAQLERI